VYNGVVRLTTETTIKDAVCDLSDGNPGALTAMMQCVTSNVLDGGATIWLLDQLGIYGPAIWVTFKDYANGDTAKMLLGLKERDPDLLAHIEKNGYSVNREAWDSK
jgi:hypothetical protein